MTPPQPIDEAPNARGQHRVLVVADTHLRAERSEQITTILAPHLDVADVIIHAGDVTDEAVLTELRRTAHVHAVLGEQRPRTRSPSRTIGWIVIADDGKVRCSHTEL